MGKQRRRICYILASLIIILFGLSTVLWAESGFCPIPSVQNESNAELAQEKIPDLSKSYSVPPNQVLLKIGTGTW